MFFLIPPFFCILTVLNMIAGNVRQYAEADPIASSPPYNFLRLFKFRGGEELIFCPHLARGQNTGKWQ